MVIWISSLTMNLPSSIALRVTPKSWRLIVVSAPYPMRWPIMGSLNSPVLHDLKGDGAGVVLDGQVAGQGVPVVARPSEFGVGERDRRKGVGLQEIR